MPFRGYNQSDFVDELVKVGHLGEFDQYWVLLLSEDEFGKHHRLRTWFFCRQAARDDLLYTLEKEDLVGVLVIVEAFLCLDGDRPEVAVLNQLESTLVR